MIAAQFAVSIGSENSKQIIIFQMAKTWYIGPSDDGFVICLFRVYSIISGNNNELMTTYMYINFIYWSIVHIINDQVMFKYCF